MHYLIYQTTNKIDGMIYIGVHRTKDVDDGYQGSGTRLLRAIKKHGKENFTTIILHTCKNTEDMFKIEAGLVTESFVKRHDTYNIGLGGFGGWAHMSKADHRAMCSWGGRKGGLKFAHLMATDPEFRREVCRKNRASQLRHFETHHGTFLGKVHSDETKQKMRESAKITSKGSRNSQFGTMWITDGTNNKKIKKDSVMPIGWHAGRTITYA